MMSRSPTGQRPEQNGRSDCRAVLRHPAWVCTLDVRLAQSQSFTLPVGVDLSDHCGGSGEGIALDDPCHWLTVTGSTVSANDLGVRRRVHAGSRHLAQAAFAGAAGAQGFPRRTTQLTGGTLTWDQLQNVAAGTASYQVPLKFYPLARRGYSSRHLFYTHRAGALFARGSLKYPRAGPSPVFHEGHVRVRIPRWLARGGRCAGTQTR